MREEFASYSFLALTVLGVVLLGAGILAASLSQLPNPGFGQ